MRVMDVLREGEDTGTGGGAPAHGTEDLIPRSEAQKAFKARDEIKGQVREWKDAGLILTPEEKAEIDALRTAAQQAEEDRKKKAGEFDSLRVDLLKKHEAALTERDQKVSHATERLHGVLKDHAFASAVDWFGKDGKTILTSAIASAYFGKYVAVEEHQGAERVVVKDLKGHVILDAKTGEPAAFSDAIGELIGMLPDKDSILRGSGKTGSGSSGGSGTTDHGAAVDVRRPMSAAELRDPKVRAALKAQMAQAGGLQVAAGLNRR